MRSEVTLSEACSLIVDCPHKTAPQSDVAYAYAVGTKAVLDGRIMFARARAVDAATYATWIERATPRPDDLILCREAPVGPVAIVPKTPRVCLGQRTVLLRADPEIANPRFLLYALLAPDSQASLRQLAEGSTVPHLNVEAIRGFPISVPSLEEQSSISFVLRALDDKIECNRRLAGILESLAQTTLEQALQTSAASWDHAWPEAKLADVLEVLETGSRPRGGVKHITSGVPSIGAESIVGAGIFDFTKAKFVSRDYYDALHRGRLQDRDVLLYKDGGRPGDFRPHVSMVGEGFPFEEAAINEHVYRARIKPPYSQDFLYLWLRSPRLTDEMRSRGTGVAIPGLNSSAVKELPIIVPTVSVLEFAQTVIEPMITNVLRLAAEARLLEQLRGALLPKLVSGAIPVPEMNAIDVSGPPEAQVLASR
jgi:type I restriction enzyme S subunit